MSDFSLLATVKSHLQTNIEEQNFYITPHTDMVFPCCLLELDEIEQNLKLGANTVQSKIKFRTVCLDGNIGVKTSFDCSQKINRCLDGKTLELPDGRTAIIKLMGSVVDISKKGDKKTVSHHYETVLRG
ncbi:MAG: hypothetical protein KF798_06805 [Candidatus Paracaedibacteraceae bacterium]|nr:hypothetical protein [Candidatus Paracaedibacteraceae bacterium]